MTEITIYELWFIQLLVGVILFFLLIYDVIGLGDFLLISVVILFFSGIVPVKKRGS